MTVGLKRRASNFATFCALLLECLANATRPSSWTRPVRDRLWRQLLFSGVEAIPFTVWMAVLVGGILVMQVNTWMAISGEVGVIGEMGGFMLVRELAPFLSVIVIIAASASAMTTELAGSSFAKEPEMLEAQGINVLHYLMLPRCIGMALSVVTLSVFFVVASFATTAVILTVITGGWHAASILIHSVAMNLGPIDFANFGAKTMIPGLFTGVICCQEGLKPIPAVTMVPVAVTTAIMRSINVTLIVNAVCAVITYV